MGPACGRAPLGSTNGFAATPGAGSHLLHVTPEMQHVGESFFLPGFLLGLLPCLLFLFASSLLLPGLAVGQEGMDGDLVSQLACKTQPPCAPWVGLHGVDGLGGPNALQEATARAPVPRGRLTAMRAWRSFSLSLRIRCCSALSARRCSCRRRGQWPGCPRTSLLSLGTHPCLLKP